MVRSIVAAMLVALAGCAPQKAPPAPAPSAAAATTAPAAALTASPRANGEAPPTVNGMYIDKGACPGEGCYFGRMQATAALDLFETPAAAPVIVGKVAKGEWVDTITTEDRFAPLKGAVVADSPPLKTGDTVYRLGYDGEGCFTVWDKGEHGSWCDDGSPPPNGIAWDKTPPQADGSQGLWVQVKRATGPGGWLRDPKDVRCIGYQDRDADCPPLPR